MNETPPVLPPKLKPRTKRGGSQLLLPVNRTGPLLSPNLKSWLFGALKASLGTAFEVSLGVPVGFGYKPLNMGVFEDLGPPWVGLDFTMGLSSLRPNPSGPRVASPAAATSGRLPPSKVLGDSGPLPLASATVELSLARGTALMG